MRTISDRSATGQRGSNNTILGMDIGSCRHSHEAATIVARLTCAWQDVQLSGQDAADDISDGQDY